MDVEEYFKDIPPKGKRSMLEPYWPAIQKARAGGYTLDQIVGFLQNNSITITRSGLFAFIKRKEAKQHLTGNPVKVKGSSSGNDAGSETPAPLPENTAGDVPTNQVLGESGETPEERFKRLKRQEASKKFDRFKNN